MNLLDVTEDRYILHPIKYPKVFEMGKKAIASSWTVEELSFDNDLEEFNRMTPEEQFLVREILAFFASADGIVVENLVEQFCSEVQLPEARYFYSYQSHNEQIHAETYALLLQVYGGDDLPRLLRATQDSPPVKAKADFAKKHFLNDDPDRYRNFAKRLIAFSCVEGINFSASFAGIFWIKFRNYKCDALTLSNEFIARDEGSHRDFAVLLYKTFLNNLTHDEIQDIVKESVEVEVNWVNHTMPEKLIGMNAEMMTQYVQFTADQLLRAFECPPVYNVSNPFPFMEALNLSGKTNYFEKRVSEYALAGKNEGFNLEEDF